MSEMLWVLFADPCLVWIRARDRLGGGVIAQFCIFFGARSEIVSINLFRFVVACCAVVVAIEKRNANMAVVMEFVLIIQQHACAAFWHDWVLRCCGFI